MSNSSGDSQRVLLPLAKPIPPEGQHEERIAFYRRKLSYKMPVTLRYGVAIGLASGLVATTYRKSLRPLWRHTVVATAVIGLGLCYQELTGIAEEYYYISQKKPQQATN